MLDRIEQLKGQEVALEEITVTPEVVESDHYESMFGRVPQSVDYFLNFEAQFDGARRSLKVREITPVFLRSYDSRNIAKAETELMACANTTLQRIRGQGHSAIIDDNLKPAYCDASLKNISETDLYKAGADGIAMRQPPLLLNIKHLFEKYFNILGNGLS